MVCEFHHLRYRRVELKRKRVFFYLLDELVKLPLQFPTVDCQLPTDNFLLRFPNPVQKPPHSQNSFGIPGNRLLERPHKSLVEAKSVRTELHHHLVWINHVFARFAHLLPVRSQHHAVGGPFSVGLNPRNQFQIGEHLVPESGVEQMQRRVLHSPVVPVHRQPIIHFLPVGKPLIILGIKVAQEVPGAPSPVWHGISLSSRLRITDRAMHFDPFFDFGERRCAGLGGLIIFDERQPHRQFFFRYCHYRVFFAINFTEVVSLSGLFFLLFAFLLPAVAAEDNGNRFAPIVLA